MTAPSGRTITPDAGPRPTLLTVAAILLGVTAILGVLVPISQLTDRTYVGCQIAVASANATPTSSSSPSSSPSASPSPTSSASASPRASTVEQQRQQFDDCVARNAGAVSPADDKAISDATVPLLLQGVLPFILLAGLAYFAFRGVPLVRWFVVGAWLIGGFTGLIPFGPLQVFQVSQIDLPVLTAVLLVLGSVTFTAAAALVNLKPVTAYFSAKRPVRTAGAGGRPAGGGLFGGLFGPRPPAGGKGPASSSSSSTTTTSLEKSPPPANPASRAKGRSGGSGNTGRGKGKRRG